MEEKSTDNNYRVIALTTMVEETVLDKNQD